VKEIRYNELFVMEDMLPKRSYKHEPV